MWKRFKSSSHSCRAGALARCRRHNWGTAALQRRVKRTGMTAALAAGYDECDNSPNFDRNRKRVPTLSQRTRERKAPTLCHSVSRSEAESPPRAKSKGSAFICALVGNLVAQRFQRCNYWPMMNGL
jgi:hypothetical protein